MAKDDLIEELISKHNDLCDMLNDMKLNPLADFEDFKVDSDLDLDDEDDDSEDIEDESEDNGKDGFEY